jgi:hypothetical protein
MTFLVHILIHLILVKLETYCLDGKSQILISYRETFLEGFCRFFTSQHLFCVGLVMKLLNQNKMLETSFYIGFFDNSVPN